VRVRDSGVGIPAVDLPHIFDVFVQVDSSWQRTQGGLGIGLSLVKEFVGLHDGRVEARSEGPGRGSEFVVHLPLAVESATGGLQTVLPEKVHGPQRRILVVDDNRDAAESLAMLLGYLGHMVRTAYDGEAGIAMAADFRPQLILMDIGMPKMSGNDAARRIRAEPWGAGVFLVALTGWGTNEDRQRTHDAGFDRHLVKPVEFQDLTKLLGELPITLPATS
jgi:CheY-like chemotaxis protein